MRGVPIDPLEDDARRCFDLVYADVDRGLAAARRLLDEDLGARARALALRAVGLALRERNELDAAVDALEEGIREAAGQPDVQAMLRSTLALAVGLGGDWAAARALNEASMEALPPEEAGRGAAQQATILQRLGRNDEALAWFDRAIGLLDAVGDEVGLAKTQVNAGLAASDSGDDEQARRWLEDAAARAAARRDGHRQPGLRGMAAGGSRGDPPALLRLRAPAARVRRRGIDARDPPARSGGRPRRRRVAR